MSTGIDLTKKSGINTEKPALEFKCFFCEVTQHRRYQISKLGGVGGDYDQGKAKLIWNCKGCGTGYKITIDNEGIANFDIIRSVKLQSNDPIFNILKSIDGSDKKEKSISRT
jgi:hypothetical protein